MPAKPGSNQLINSRKQRAMGLRPGMSVKPMPASARANGGKTPDKKMQEVARKQLLKMEAAEHKAEGKAEKAGMKAMRAAKAGGKITRRADGGSFSKMTPDERKKAIGQFSRKNYVPNIPDPDNPNRDESLGAKIRRAFTGGDDPPKK